jgi:hypothetical protein
MKEKEYIVTEIIDYVVTATSPAKACEKIADSADRDKYAVHVSARDARVALRDRYGLLNNLSD